MNSEYLKVCPKEYQIDGIQWALDKELNSEYKGGLLADEVGLGKTYQMIGLMLANRVSKSLILVPKSLINQWCNEINNLTDELHIIKIENLKKEGIEFKQNKHNVVIMGINQVYGRLSECFAKTLIHNIYWDRLIIDEAHMIKNKKSKLHKACKEIYTKYKWLLSATPVMNSMSDFVSLMSFFDISQEKCQTEKDDIVKNMIMRRTKDQIKNLNPEFELPKSKIEIVEAPFETRDELDYYNKTYEIMKSKVKKAKRNNNFMEIIEHLLRMRQFCICPQLYIDGLDKKYNEKSPLYTGNCTKLNTFINLIKKKPNDEKALVFFQFIGEMKIYKQALKKEGYECSHISGCMNLDQRTNVINTFKRSKTLNILFMQINVGGVGYNLQEANWVYIISPTWNPAIEHQAIGRCHRSGQKKEVNVYKIIINDPNDTNTTYIERRILDLQNTKNVLITELLSCASSKINIREVCSLFK